MKHPYACNSLDHTLSRRQMLGALAGAAGTLSLGSLAQPALAEQLKAKHKQVLFIWLDGGISQLESWDPKPNSEFGGPFGAIATSVPGVHISELMPHTARHVDKLAIVRSMCTKDENHSTGVARIQQGDPKNRGVTYPFLGSAITKLADPPPNELPRYMHIKPGRGGFIYQDAGFLGAKYGALALGEGKPPIHIHRPESVTDDIDAARNELRLKANARFRAGRREAEVDAYGYSYDMAQQLMKRKDLFDDRSLSPQDVERYGTHPLGRHLLQARRLVEAGVQFVKVTSYHWDTHGDNFNMHLDMVPQIDRPFAALIEDFEARGMLDHVLIVLMSEFGRTPKINPRLGRDHWPEAWSLAMAGCGLKRGVVAGKTTPNGAWVDTDEFDVGHLFHTVFRAIGIDPRQTSYLNNGQPLPIAHEECKAIEEVLA
jgi:hypothetical protein